MVDAYAKKAATARRMQRGWEREGLAARQLAMDGSQRPGPYVWMPLWCVVRRLCQAHAMSIPSKPRHYSRIGGHIHALSMP